MTTSSAFEPPEVTTSTTTEPHPSSSISLSVVDKKASSPSLNNYDNSTMEQEPTTSSSPEFHVCTGATTFASVVGQQQEPPTIVVSENNALQQPIDHTFISSSETTIPALEQIQQQQQRGSIPALNLSIPLLVNNNRNASSSLSRPFDSTDEDALSSLNDTSFNTGGRDAVPFSEQQQQQQQEQENAIMHKTIDTKNASVDDLSSESQDGTPVLFPEDTSATTTPTTATFQTGVDMSMTSPIRQNKSPPASTSSSTVSGSRRRRIAESSMILAGSETGTIKGGMTGTGGLKGGTLSPAWSMTSIPRDISATYYDNDSSDTRTENLAHPMDEKLYGLVDRYGFLVEEGRTPTAEKNGAASSSLSSSQRSVRTTHDMRRQAKVVEKEQERSLKWARMAKRQPGQIEVQYAFPESSKFIKRIYKGIPDCWRAAAWSYLITRRSTNFEPNIRRIYHDMLEISSPEEEQIDLDIPRTMHGHIMFRTRFGPGQCSLFKVLKAYSNYNHRVGYCQGMASVVAMMLTFFDEEKTFVLLSQLFDRYSINDLVIPGFPSLFEAFYIQEELTKMYAPKVFQALKTMGIATPSYASRWYITLYSAGVVPYRTLLRIWDIFLLEGFDWLYFMALALLQYHETSLIQNNFERTMEMLNAKMDIQDDERLLKLAHDLLKKARRTNIVERLKSSYAATQKQPEVRS